MTPDQRGDTLALLAAARQTRPDRYTAVLAFVRGLLATGIVDPALVWEQLEAAGINERAWRGAAAWSAPPVKVISRRSARKEFFARHGGQALPR